MKNSSWVTPCLVETTLHNGPNNTLAEATSPRHCMASQWTDFEPSYKVIHICQVKALNAYPSGKQCFKQNESKTKQGDSLNTRSSILQGRLWYDPVISLGLSMIFSCLEPLHSVKSIKQVPIRSEHTDLLAFLTESLPFWVCCRLVSQGY